MITIKLQASENLYSVSHKKDRVNLSVSLDLEKTVEVITKISFLELIKSKEKNELPYILALVVHSGGKIAFYDALALRKARRDGSLKVICTDKIRRIYYYTIQSSKDYKPQFFGAIDKHKKNDDIAFLLASHEIHTAEGKYDIASHYEKGKGVEKSLSTAYKFYKASAKQGNASAQLKMAEKFSRGIDEKAPDDFKAFKYLKLAAINGEKQAMHNLGLWYSKGKGTKIDHEEAFFWYLKAAEAKFIQAYLSLALCYARGAGIDKNFQKAAQWFKISAKEKNPHAMYYLGNCYRHGRGVKKSEVKAFDWYFKAVDSGFLRAQYRLGKCYEKGIGVEIDLAKAFYYYTQAAAVKSKRALYKLGCFYEFGIHVKQDRYAAHEYYRRACYYNYAPAVEKIDKMDIEWFNFKSSNEATAATSGEERP